ncbi:MAG: SAM-dependent chlorinase/fluorinase [Actinomycetota bacterium]|nr:SAM-dependent chlorinase/fluorinase [Actinomycetota bacterium]
MIRRIAPEVPIVDVTHGITRHGVRHGALVLAASLPYMPVGVHVAVVDPQVGTERRAVALRCVDGRLLVGPDNGVLSLAWERAGGVDEAVDISRSPHRLEPVSATFHGRDVFAPVAAHLASGAELSDAGDPLDPEQLVRLALPEPRLAADSAAAHALVIDGFGNVALDLRHEHLRGMGLTIGSRVSVEAGVRRREAVFVRTFADVAPGALLIYEDAWGYVALAVNRGDASAELELSPDDELRIAPAS